MDSNDNDTGQVPVREGQTQSVVRRETTVPEPRAAEQPEGASARTAEQERRAKVRSTLTPVAVRASMIGRYLWAELRAVTTATTAQLWRLIRHGDALVRLAVSKKSLRQAQLDLGEKLYQAGSGDASVRNAISELDAQIKAAKEAKRSASKLVAERRKQLIQLAELSASASDASAPASEREHVLTCRQNLEKQRDQLEAGRMRLWPSCNAEITRVCVGVGVCLMLLVTVIMFARSKPGVRSRLDETSAVTLADAKAARAGGDAGHDDAGSSEQTAPAQVPIPGQKSNIPSPAIAPFGVAQAKQHQQAWALHLDVPVEAVNSLGMRFVLIPPGEFLMGSPDSDVAAVKDEKPQHRVRISKPFYLGM